MVKYRVAFWISLPLVVTALVDGLGYAMAARTDSGLVADDYYIKSLKPDPEDQRRARFRQLGWHAAFTAPAVGDRVAFALDDAQGKALVGGQVKVTLFCLTRAANDRDLTLHEERPGRYAAVVPDLAQGTYEARFHLSAAAQDVAWYGRFRR